MYFTFKPTQDIITINLLVLKTQINQIILSHPFLKINFVNINQVDSSGIYFLISLYKKLKNNKGDLKFINVKKELRELFNLTEISSFYTE